MPKSADSFHDFTRELFAEMGPITVKHFFGGGGVYAGGVMFAMIADDAIYLKADETLQAELKTEGCGPFIWEPQTGPRAGERIALGYWRLPDAALDDPQLAAELGRKALKVARAKAAEKKPKAARKKVVPAQKKKR